MSYIALIRRTTITIFGIESDYIEIPGLTYKSAKSIAENYIRDMSAESDSTMYSLVAVFPNMV